MRNGVKPLAKVEFHFFFGGGGWGHMPPQIPGGPQVPHTRTHTHTKEIMLSVKQMDKEKSHASLCPSQKIKAPQCLPPPQLEKS